MIPRVEAATVCHRKTLRVMGKITKRTWWLASGHKQGPPRTFLKDKVPPRKKDAANHRTDLPVKALIFPNDPPATAPQCVAAQCLGEPKQ